MKCNNHKCRYHQSRKMLRNPITGQYITLVQGCKYEYCKLQKGGKVIN